MPVYVVEAVGASVSIAGAQSPGRESGPQKGIGSIVRTGEVTR